MKRPKVNYDLLSDFCLSFVYGQFVTDGRETTSPQEIQSAVPDVPLNLIKLTLEELENSSFILETTISTQKIKPLSPSIAAMGGNLFDREYVEVMVPSGRFKITKRGLNQVDGWDDEKFELIRTSGHSGELVQDSPLQEKRTATRSKEESHQISPASDRYVTTKDNRPEAKKLDKTLDEIRDEYSKDHNKGELKNLNYFDEFVVEVESTSAQFKAGKVRISQLTEGLVPALKRIQPFLSAYPALHKLVEDALKIIDLLLSAIGKK